MAAGWHEDIARLLDGMILDINKERVDEVCADWYVSSRPARDTAITAHTHSRTRLPFKVHRWRHV